MTTKKVWNISIQVIDKLEEDDELYTKEDISFLIRDDIYAMLNATGLKVAKLKVEEEETK